jgi:hypothetical protein
MSFVRLRRSFGRAKSNKHSKRVEQCSQSEARSDLFVCYFCSSSLQCRTLSRSLRKESTAANAVPVTHLGRPEIHFSSHPKPDGTRSVMVKGKLKSVLIVEPLDDALIGKLTALGIKADIKVNLPFPDLIAQVKANAHLKIAA